MCGRRTGLIFERESDVGQKFDNSYEQVKFEVETAIREAISALRQATEVSCDRNIRSDARAREAVTGTLPVVLAAALVLWATGASARSPLVEEVRAFATRYHENLSRLDMVRKGLEEASRDSADVETLLALARVSFIWGDVRATTREQKLQAYDTGRQAAKRAVELDPRSAEAHFWFATNTARWGQVNGIVRSIFLLPTVKWEIQVIRDLDPSFTAVYALAGNVYYEVPRVLGGDLDLAEQMFRKGLEQDSRFTGMRVGLAKTLIKKGRIGEARQELQAVLDEKQPRNVADWTVKDSKKARELLESIRDKS